MNELKAKTLTSALVNWEAYIAKTVYDIKVVQERMKDNTEQERNDIKEKRKNLKAAVWKKDSIMALMKDAVTDGKEVSGTITLEDFDVEQAEIDIALVRNQFEEASKDE